MSTVDGSGVGIIDDGGVRTVTFDRPDKLNAVTPDDLRVATDAMRGAGGRAVVFTGAGERAFCGGMHLESFRDLDPAAARELITVVRDFLAAVRTGPVATAAMVNGYCLGVAFELALVCDVRVAVPDARFGLPEVAVGIPSVADAALLSQHVGLSLAREMTLTGDLYPVESFERTGLLNRVADLGDLPATTHELLARITRHTPTVVAAQKRLFEAWQNSGLVEGAAVSVDEFGRVFESPETLEQVRTVLDGRARHRR